MKFGNIYGPVNTDRYWQWMEENQNWNINAAVDAINPYKAEKVWKEGDPNRDHGTQGKWVTKSNNVERNRATTALQERYKSAKDADRNIMAPVLQMGSADASAQMLSPKSEADVIAPESGSGGERPDFGGSADSGRNPAAGRGAGPDSGMRAPGGGAGLLVDETKRGGRRSAGGLRI